MYRIGVLDWFPRLFSEIWTPGAVVLELEEGGRRGYKVPNPGNYDWLKIVDLHYMPSEWLVLDLGGGELAAMALALENPGRIILLDEALARSTAQAAGLKVWGTLKILLEAKAQGLIENIEPFVNHLIEAGLWISDDIKHRILLLAGEN